MTGTKSEAKKVQKKQASKKNDSEPKNGKQRTPIEKLAPKKNDWNQKFGSKKVNKKMTP